MTKTQHLSYLRVARPNRAAAARRRRRFLGEQLEQARAGLAEANGLPGEVTQGRKLLRRQLPHPAEGICSSAQSPEFESCGFTGHRGWLVMGT